MYTLSEEQRSTMKELEDQPWFPPLLRDFQTAFIGHVVAGFRVYDPFVRYVREQELEIQPMFDLCSGSGEPARSMFEESAGFGKLTLSDKFPPRSAGNDPAYIAHSVDVLSMDFTAGTCYTMFNAFHHFSDAEKVQIVERVLQAGAKGFFVEILQPTLWCAVKVLFMTTAGCLLFTPFIRPFSWKRLFFTYILPVNILSITFDGMVSVCKVRSVKKYASLFAYGADRVRVSRLKGKWLNLTVIEIIGK
ncbi:MAG: hypothetical protein R2794_01220 [Chitinophagales bacterium]